LLLEVDAQVRFSWIMLGREPRAAATCLRRQDINQFGRTLGDPNCKSRSKL
jgi:hypothetical protein